MANIASGSHADSLSVAMLMAKIIALVADESIAVVEQAVWVVGNVSGDCDECRLYTLQALLPLTKILTTNQLTPDINFIQINNLKLVCAWAVSNIMRGQTQASALSSTGNRRMWIG